MTYGILGDKRKLIKKGGSAAVTLPKEAIEYIGNPDAVYFLRIGESIIIENAKKLDEEFSIVFPIVESGIENLQQYITEHPDVGEKLRLIKEKYRPKKIR